MDVKKPSNVIAEIEKFILNRKYDTLLKADMKAIKEFVLKTKYKNVSM